MGLFFWQNNFVTDHVTDIIIFCRKSSCKNIATKYFCQGIVLQFFIYVESDVADDTPSYFANMAFDMANKFYVYIALYFCHKSLIDVYQ